MPKLTSVAWFQRMEEGVKQFAQDTGIDAYQDGSADADVAQQAQYVQDAIAQGLMLYAAPLSQKPRTRSETGQGCWHYRYCT